MNTVDMKPHQGRNIKRIREILGVKQDALAIDLGLSQQAVSLMEQRETLDVPTLQKVSQVLGVPDEVIKNFSEEAVINNIQNNYDGSQTSGSNIIADGVNNQYTFNPIEKIVELYNEKMALYERMLQTEKEKNELLQKLIEKG